MKHLRRQGVNVPVVGSAALLSSKESLVAMDNAFENLTLSVAMKQIDPNSAFAKKYQRAFNEPFGAPQLFSARAYDAYIALATALRACPKAPVGACLQKRLIEMPEHNGIGGPLKFDRFGDVSPVFSAYTIKGSEYVPTM